MSWYLKEQLLQILAEEEGTQIYAPGSRDAFALVYPNTYHVGMSNLGMHIIYHQINGRGDTACERLFLPDKKIKQEYIRTNTPLMTLESQRPLYEFPLIGFAISFEMDYFNMLDILKMGKVPLLASERDENDPLVIIGGPCATFNPEPIADFVDICIIGEGEEVIHDVLNTYYQCKNQSFSRLQILKHMAKIEGVYVPNLYEPIYSASGILIGLQSLAEEAPTSIRRRKINDLDAYCGHSAIITTRTEFRNMFLIEIARGCGRHCRFCMAGYCFRQPRIRSLSSLKQAIALAAKYGAKIGLMGAAISDYPEIDTLCNLIRSQHLELSVASLRADSLTEKTLESLANCGHQTITLAPEAGSEKMRCIINKSITDEQLYSAVEKTIRSGIPNIRLYIMIGLPFEEDADIAEIIELAYSVKNKMVSLGSKGKLTLSVNPFIPKPFTPFQWMPMAIEKTINAKYKYLKSALKKEKGIELLVEPLKEAYIQAILARGDRRLSAALLCAHEQGGSKSFKQALKQVQLTEEFYLSEKPQNSMLPWQHLSMGFDPNYLIKELQYAKEMKFTAPCVDGCKKCGICC